MDEKNSEDSQNMTRPTASSNIKGHVEIGHLTKFGALRLNRDQVMTHETWLKSHTNLCNFVTASPKTI